MRFSSVVCLVVGVLLGHFQSALTLLEYTRQIPHVIPKELQEIELVLSEEDVQIGLAFSFSAPAANGRHVSSGRIQSFSFNGCDKAKDGGCRFEIKYAKSVKSETIVLEKDILMGRGTNMLDTFNNKIRQQGLSLATGETPCEENWCITEQQLHTNGSRKKRASLGCENNHCKYGVSKYTLNKQRQEDAKILRDTVNFSTKKTRDAAQLSRTTYENSNTKFKEGTDAFSQSVTDYSKGLINLHSHSAEFAEQLMESQCMAIANQVWAAARSYYKIVEHYLKEYHRYRQLRVDAFMCAFGDCDQLMKTLAEGDNEIEILSHFNFDFRIMIASDDDKVYINYYKPKDYALGFALEIIQPALMLGSDCLHQDSSDTFFCSKCFRQSYNSRIDTQGTKNYISVMGSPSTNSSCSMGQLKEPFVISTKISCVSITLGEKGFDVVMSGSCVSEHVSLSRTLYVDNSVTVVGNGSLSVELVDPSIVDDGIPSLHSRNRRSAGNSTVENTSEENSTADNATVEHSPDVFIRTPGSTKFEGVMKTIDLKLEQLNAERRAMAVKRTTSLVMASIALGFIILVYIHCSVQIFMSKKKARSAKRMHEK